MSIRIATYLTLAFATFAATVPLPACGTVCATSADCDDGEWCSAYTCAPLGGDADPCPLSLAWGSAEPCASPWYLCVVATGGHDYDGEPVCTPTCDACAQIGECTGDVSVQPACEVCGCPE